MRGNRAAVNILISLLTLVLLYPLIWLVSSSLKSNSEIFTSVNLLPRHPMWDSYLKGWSGAGGIGFERFFTNSFLLVVPTVLGTLISSILVAYGFARFTFPYKNALFGVMISTLMLPGATIIIPRFLLFKTLGWLNSYLPFILPALFGCAPFFIFLMVQFMRGIPRELDESAVLDGCSTFVILTRIIVPLSKAAIFSVAVFQFVWTWNDYFNSLIYINTPTKFPVSVGLKAALDTMSDSVAWNQILAMSVVSVLPCVVLFFLAQRYFVEGIATQGLKT